MTNIYGAPTPPPTNTARKIFGILIMIVAVLILLVGSAGGLCVTIILVADKGKDPQATGLLFSVIGVLLVGGGLFWAGLKLILKK